MNWRGSQVALCCAVPHCAAVQSGPAAAGSRLAGFLFGTASSELTDEGRWDVGSSHRLTESLLDPLVLIILPEARGLVSVHRVPHKEEEIDPTCHTDPVNSGLKLVVVGGRGWGIKLRVSFYGNQCVCVCVWSGWEHMF